MFFEIRKFPIFRRIEFFPAKLTIFLENSRHAYLILFFLAFAQNLKMDKTKEKKHVHLNAEEKRHVAGLIAMFYPCSNRSTCQYSPWLNLNIADGWPKENCLVYLLVKSLLLSKLSEFEFTLCEIWMVEIWSTKISTSENERRIGNYRRTDL